MKMIPAGKFREKCFSLLNEIARTKEEIVITKYGKPVARVLPFVTEKDRKMEGMNLKGCATYVGDIISPLDVEWEAGGKEGS